MDLIRTFIENDRLVKIKRAHIAQHAAKLFFKKGFKGTSMREIATACGIPPGSIYNYIGSKKDILHFICEDAAESWRPKLDEMIKKYKGDNITDLLCQCMAVYFKIADEIKEQNGFFNREIRNFHPEDRQRLLASQEAIVSFFEGLLERGISNGELRMHSPELVAHNILMAGNNWGERKWFLSPRFTLDEYTKLQIETILTGIKTEKNNNGNDSQNA